MFYGRILYIITYLQEVDNEDIKYFFCDEFVVT